VISELSNFLGKAFRWMSNKRKDRGKGVYMHLYP
jgi:hypothetical protein